MIFSNLMALQVVLPLIAAPICVVLSGRRVAWVFSLCITLVTFWIALTLFQQVQETGILHYAMGNWTPPFGIGYRLDVFSAAMLLLISFIGVMSVAFAKRSVKKEIEESKRAAFYAVFLLCFAGLLGLVITNDIFNIYVFLEISSLAMYGLIAMGRDRRALVSSFEYLILGTIGATLILIAIGIIYLMTGSLSISDLSERLPSVIETAPIRAALAFFIVGLLLKTAVFPLHLWLANGYTNAPSFVSVFLSATGTKVSLYLLMRILFTFFGVEFSFNIIPVGEVLKVLAVLGLICASVIAAYQHNVKRLLAYSSVAQLGYILLGISFVSSLGLTASIVHLFNHAIAKAALFMVVGAVYLRCGGVRLSNFRGMGKTMPFTMAAFVIAGLSLIGFPLTAGFVSKYYIVMAAIEQQQWLALLVVVISSVLAVVYVWKVVEVAYFYEPAHRHKEAPMSMLIPLWSLVFCSIGLGVFSEWPVHVASQVAVSFLVGSP